MSHKVNIKSFFRMFYSGISFCAPSFASNSSNPYDISNRILRSIVESNLDGHFDLTFQFIYVTNYKLVNNVSPVFYIYIKKKAKGAISGDLDGHGKTELTPSCLHFILKIFYWTLKDP